MRVIRVELPALLRTRDPGLSLASEEIRAALFRQLASIEYELSEAIRHNASGYFPATFSVFVRMRLDPEKIQLTSEFWVVDPSSSWPQGLLTRRAWRLFVPLLAHIARETIEQRVPEVMVDINEKAAKVGAFATARAWRDPIILGTAVCLLTTVIWLWVFPAFWPNAAKPSLSRIGEAPATMVVEPPAVASPATAATAESARSAGGEPSGPAAGLPSGTARLGVPSPIEVPRRPDDRTRR